MPIDNDWYDDLGDSWWDPRGPVAALHDFNTARTAYAVGVIRGALPEITHPQVLDVGAGGGLFSASLAAAGFEVVGLDASAPSLQVARRHTVRAEDRQTPAYVTGNAMLLPLADASFDAVVCSEVLEHVSDDTGLKVDDHHALGEQPGSAGLEGVVAFSDGGDEFGLPVSVDVSGLKCAYLAQSLRNHAQPQFFLNTENVGWAFPPVEHVDVSVAERCDEVVPTVSIDVVRDEACRAEGSRHEVHLGGIGRRPVPDRDRGVLGFAVATRPLARDREVLTTVPIEVSQG